ncbi:MAG TPA: histidine kinase dimerization/phosphoacceptor domain -containing protein, partial [Azospirillaceae bacterium]|nr:histidine kinase dimerization/phosphoacceptor domain -containing protein [Azospirillaceae bacterium]
MDRKIATEIAALETLAISASLDRGDFATFEIEANRVLERQPTWMTIRLTDTLGKRRVVSLDHSHPGPLPASPDSDEAELAALTGKPTVSGLLRPSPEEREPAVMLRVPVERDGEIRYTLSAVVRAIAFGQLLREQPLPQGWVASIIDQNRLIVGRTTIEDEFVGTPVTPSLAAEMERGTGGTFFAGSKEGERRYSAFLASPQTRWAVVVGAPAVMVEAPMRRTQNVVLGGGVLALLIAAALTATMIASIVRRQGAERRLLHLEADRTAARRLADVAANFPGIIYRRVLHPDGHVSYPYLSDGIATVCGVFPTADTKTACALDDVALHLLPEDGERWRDTLLRSADTLEPFVIEGRIDTSEGLRWVRSMAHTGRLEDGSVVWDGVVLDVTDLKAAQARLAASLAEKETLLREIHHRVKNNLQVIWSLIQLEAMQVSDPHGRERLEVIGQRISVLGRLHEQLYTSSDFDRIDVGLHLERLAASLRELHIHAGSVVLDIDARHLFCDLDTAIPLGLIANELIGNSLKHGFPDGKAGGRVCVRLHRVGDAVELIVADNGVGGFAVQEGEPPAVPGLGMRLIQALVGQLHAAIRFDPAEPEGGTRAVVTLAGNRFMNAKQGH